MPFINYTSLSKKVLLCTWLYLCIACVRKVELEDTDFPITPGINCLFSNNNNDTCKMWVGLSGSIVGDKPIPKIEDAVVELWEEGLLKGKLKFDSLKGYYFSTNFKAQSDKSYTCRVRVNGFPEIYAETEIPEVNPVSNMEFIPIAGLDAAGIPYGSFKFTFKNNLRKRLYFDARICTVMYPDDNNFTAEPIYLNPSKTDPVILHEGLPLSLFSNELIRDSVYTMTLHFYNENTNPVIYFEFRSVSEAYYQYARSIYLYNQGRFPYLFETTPVAQVYSNVKNAWGVFAGYSVHKVGFIGEWENNEYR